MALPKSLTCNQMSVTYTSFGGAFDVGLLTLALQKLSQDNSISIQRIQDDRECLEKLDSRQAAIDISNNYSRRFIDKGASERRARRSKPYRDDRRNYVKGSVDDTQSSKRCTYISPMDGHRCEKINKSPQEAGRHWRSCHLHKEAKAMLEGRLPISKGTAITSKAQLEKIKLDIMCGPCGRIITRSDSMRRHLKSNCKRENGD